MGRTTDCVRVPRVPGCLGRAPWWSVSSPSCHDALPQVPPVALPSAMPPSRGASLPSEPDPFGARRTTSPASGTRAPSTSESRGVDPRAATPDLIWPPGRALPTHPSHATPHARPPCTTTSNRRHDCRVPLLGFCQFNVPRAHHEHQRTPTSATGQLPASDDLDVHTLRCVFCCFV